MCLKVVFLFQILMNVKICCFWVIKLGLQIKWKIKNIFFGVVDKFWEFGDHFICIFDDLYSKLYLELSSIPSCLFLHFLSFCSVLDDSVDKRMFDLNIQLRGNMTYYSFLLKINFLRDIYVKRYTILFMGSLKQENLWNCLLRSLGGRCVLIQRIKHLCFSIDASHAFNL